MQTTHSINQQHSAHSVRVAVASGRAANAAPVLTSQHGSSLNGRFVENSQAAKNKKRNQGKRTKEFMALLDHDVSRVRSALNPLTNQDWKRAKYLLKVGVDLDYVVPKGESFADRCETPWKALIFYGYQDLIELYLKHHPEAVNQRALGNGRTPLYVAAANGRQDIVCCLLQQPKIDINRADDEGNTPLHLAALPLSSIDETWFMRQLFDHTDELGRKDLNVNPVNHKGETPLHFACSSNHPEFVRCLLTHPDVDVKCTDKKGQTPLAITVSSCYPSIRIIELLLRHTTADGKPADLGVSDWMAWFEAHKKRNINHFKLVPVLLETGRLTPEQGWSIATEPFGVDTYRIDRKEYIRRCMAILGNTPEKRQAILKRLETLASSPGHDALRVCVAHQFGQPDRACEQISRTLDWRVVLSRRSEEEMVQFLEHIGTYCKAAKDTEASNFFEKLITEVKSRDKHGFKRDPLEVWNALKQELPASFRA